MFGGSKTLVVRRFIRNGNVSGTWRIKETTSWMITATIVEAFLEMNIWAVLQFECIWVFGVGCVHYLRAHSRPLSPSSSSSLMVEGMDGSKAFRSTTPWPSLCSTPTLTPLPLCWNCTRRMASLLTPLTLRCCGFGVRFLMTNFLMMLKTRGHRRICQLTGWKVWVKNGKVYRKVRTFKNTYLDPSSENVAEWSAIIFSNWFLENNNIIQNNDDWTG